MDPVPELNLSSYRWPAEWEPHAATWLAWPINPETWPGHFDGIPAAFADFVAAIALFEPVCVLLGDASGRTAAHKLIDKACAAAGSAFEVQLIDIAVNDSWCRDYGPIFLNRRDSVATGAAQIVIDWGYNSWGGKYPPWDLDAQVAQKIAQRLNIPAVSPGIILEGGAIEGNGSGTVLTTENCLLNPNRNAGLTKKDLQKILHQYLQTDTVVWLPGHGILGDDTDGHIDQVARFVSTTDVVVAAPYDDDAPEAADLRANLEAVIAGRNSQGTALQALKLKMPAPKYLDQHRLPACYCNFYLANGGVIVPTFRDPADDAACQVLQTAFPDHHVVGVDALNLIWGLGAFHCMTQQQPAAP